MELTPTPFSYSPRRVEKDWGYELIFADEMQYAGKILYFPHADANFSYHFHIDKKETWYVLNGSFKLIISTYNNKKDYKKTLFLGPGDCITILPGLVHQLISQENDSQIIEVSTFDDPVDNHRITRKSLLNE